MRLENEVAVPLVGFSYYLLLLIFKEKICVFEM